MNTDKEGLVVLAELFFQKGGKTVIVSPGSRNAPIFKAFQCHSEIECVSIVDERAAAFFALGIAQSTGRPVGLICTSGTALLNYAPAMAEAFYQNLPLVAITADRPSAWIDQAEGQSIQQEGAFRNFSRYSIQMESEFRSEDERWFAERKINEALNRALLGDRGPVHINVPLSEPLYQEKEWEQIRVKNIQSAATWQQLTPEEEAETRTLWNASKRKMILCGSLPPNDSLNVVLSQLAERSDTVVLCETVSNLSGENLISTVDRALECLNTTDDTKPDLLISIGAQVVSKRIKAFLRGAGIKHHWNFSKEFQVVDTFQSLNRIYPIEPVELLSFLSDTSEVEDTGFKSSWLQAHQQGRKGHDAFLNQAPFSDLKAFGPLLQHIPANYHLQLGNSSVVRYAQLFESPHIRSQRANRGTSGIDGSASTAAGFGYGSKEPVVHISGDISFLYDSNSLWNESLPKDFRIIVINNQGGGIFRYIAGPRSVDGFEQYLETHHGLNLQGIATTFGLEYRASNNEAELEEQLKVFFSESNTARLLEVFTPRLDNAEVLKHYFTHLKDYNHG
ncbi:2-succinyl-5-enolpyruvyl-6-hydroxy-3-cyclohexene-1-carboxylic-acid synthase [bacterium SCSIO 12741]|nr:2-succinyl-5-enolpyruvyl-6-hydroxy-3-cyclohexene-1-carboxylic-acid synthase [bacterium SCSIO 12741]